MTERIESLQADAPGPLGAHWDGRGCHFAVYSQHADAVELCLFDAPNRHEVARLRMPDCSDGVWHGYLPGVRPGQLYGYRVYGPYRPEDGHRFNPNKLLVDPYARQLAGELRWHDALYGYRIGSPREDLSFDRRDSAAYMPKAVVTDDYFDWGDDHPPRVPWSDTVIYELHLRGFTKLRTDLPEHDRGTFGALGHPRTIDYLRRLGVTAVELLPIQAFVHDRELVERGLSNYWGYNTLCWFAPQPGYLSDGTLGQIKWAVRELHAAGIEVILDIVFNHSCEGSELGPTLSLRGFDNVNYYRLHPEERRRSINDTGCGNTLDFTHPRVIQLAMDALRYWVTEFHVDGFRFDLGVTLGRETYGFDPGAGFFDALLQDPVLARTKLISEPWDIGPGGYQLGNHPPGIAEWNGRYRDDLRRYWRGDDGMRGALAARLQGSADIFEHQRRLPYASVNFVTAHDGFTLADLVSYEHKRNEANGEGGRDGADDNHSSGWGRDGPTDDPAILDLRERVRRSQLATLLFAYGTPMLLAGDEFGQTQHGNNNVYCQDNDTAWLHWTLADTPQGARMRDFVACLLALRREHPLLRGRYFLHGRSIAGTRLPDLAWFDENGKRLTSADWRNGYAHLLAVRRAAARDDGGADLMLLLFNADGVDHRFSLPRPHAGYRRLVDTANPNAPVAALPEPCCDVAAHSLVLLAAVLDAQQTGAIDEAPDNPPPDTDQPAEGARGSAADADAPHAEDDPA